MRPLLGILFLVQASLSSCPPPAVTAPRAAVAWVGSCLHISCRYDLCRAGPDARLRRLHWIHQPLYDANRKDFVGQVVAELQEKTGRSRGDCSLRLPRVEVAHAGLYGLRLVAQPGRATHEELRWLERVSVNVTDVPPSPHLWPDPPPLPLTHGLQSTLGCWVTPPCPSEPPTLTWEGAAAESPGATVDTWTPPWTSWSSTPGTPTLDPPTLGSLLAFEARWDHHGSLLTCVLRAPNGTAIARASRRLQVNFPPRDVRVAVTPASPVLEGQEVTLRCQASANPPAHSFWWSFGGRGLRHAAAILAFDAIRAADAGSYGCRASNSLGTGAAPPAAIRVLHPPRGVQLQQFPAGAVVAGRGRIRFRCRIGAAEPPAVAVTWFKDGLEILRTRPDPESAPDSAPDSAPGLAPDSTPDSALDSAPDLSLGSVPDSASISTPGSAPDSAPHSAPGLAPDSTPDSAPDSTLDLAPDSVPDSAPISTPGSAPDSAPDSAPGLAPGLAPDSTLDSAPDSTPDLALDPAPDLSPSSAPDSAPISTPGSAPHLAPDSAPGLAPGLAPDSTSDSAPDSTPDLALDPAPDLSPNSAPDSAPISTPGSAPDSAPHSAPDSTSGSDLDSTPGLAPDLAPNSDPGLDLDLAPNSAPDSAVHLTPDSAPDSPFELILADPQPEDAGAYACAARNQVGLTRSPPLVLDVQYAPLEVELELEPSARVREKTEVTLRCRARAHPPPSTFEWSWDGRPLGRSLQGFWVLPAVGINQAGRYRCRVTNAVAAVESRDVALSVYYSTTTIVRKTFLGLGVGLSLLLVLGTLWCFLRRRWPQRPTAADEEPVVEPSGTFFLRNKKPRTPGSPRPPDDGDGAVTYSTLMSPPGCSSVPRLRGDAVVYTVLKRSDGAPKATEAPDYENVPPGPGGGAEEGSLVYTTLALASPGTSRGRGRDPGATGDYAVLKL